MRLPTGPGTEQVPGRCHYIIIKVTGHCPVGSAVGTKPHCFLGMAIAFLGIRVWREEGSEMVADKVRGGWGSE